MVEQKASTELRGDREPTAYFTPDASPEHAAGKGMRRSARVCSVMGHCDVGLWLDVSSTQVQYGALMLLLSVLRFVWPAAPSTPVHVGLQLCITGS